jgi:hypothetical protein
MTINRREFIEAAGLVAGGVAVTGALEAALPADAAEQRTTRVPVTAFVNGQPRTITVEPRTTLLDALREQLRLTGTKKGCDRGGRFGRRLRFAQIHDVGGLDARQSLAFERTAHCVASLDGKLEAGIGQFNLRGIAATHSPGKMLDKSP